LYIYFADLQLPGGSLAAIERQVSPTPLVFAIVPELTKFYCMIAAAPEFGIPYPLDALPNLCPSLGAICGDDRLSKNA